MSLAFALPRVPSLLTKRASAVRPFDSTRKRTTTRPNRIVSVILANAILVLTSISLITAGSTAFSAGFPDVMSRKPANVQTFAASSKAKPQKIALNDWGTQTGADADAPAGTDADASAYFAQFTAADAAERKANARLIVAIGNKRGLSDHTIAIAVATAIQESGLKNNACCDAQSHGLFQQQWTQGWGTLAQTLDRTHATNAFYDRLVRIPNRDKRLMIEVAIQVQRPNPMYYYRDWQWDRIAAQIVKSYSTS